MGHRSGDPKRRWLGAGAVLLALAGFGPSAAAGAAVNPLIAAARLNGPFLLAGRITRAINVRGEHQRETISRRWRFAATCPRGPCQTVDLTRSRRTGTDRIVLAFTNPGHYRGSGSFYAPLRCGSRIYKHGELVPFTVTVTVSAAAQTPLGVEATRVTATYANQVRINRTRCVVVPGRDAATYHGHLLP